MGQASLLSILGFGERHNGEGSWSNAGSGEWREVGDEKERTVMSMGLVSSKPLLQAWRRGCGAVYARASTNPTIAI
jgi:hypothetical protein